MLSKEKRLKLFLESLREAPSATSAESALDLIAQCLNKIEDEYSGVSFNPQGWKDDGRMYPPTEENRRLVPEGSAFRRYRSAKHNTFVSTDGSIRIETLEGKVMFNKSGLNSGK